MVGGLSAWASHVRSRSVVVVVAAGATFALGHKSHNATPPPPVPPAATTTTTTVPASPLRVVSISPAAGTTSVAAATPIRVTFSHAVAAGTVTPTITPAIPGSWTTSGATMTWTPHGGFVPFSTVHITVPAGIAGASGTNTTPLAAATSSGFSIAAGSITRLQQLLAELGYLPVTFTPTTLRAGEAAIATEPTVATSVPSSPVSGKFSWRFANTPVSLATQWTAGTSNVITRGAVMAFETDRGLAADGTAGPHVWTDLLAAAASRQVVTRPYTYLSVSQARPETLQVWSDGQVVYSTLANTGVAGAATADGTFPVFERFASTTMRGTNPDGSKYADPGVPWVAYFNGGDAVHGFPRGSYGYPQSDGCVELPISNAKVVWTMDPIGTLVTVA